MRAALSAVALALLGAAPAAAQPAAPAVTVNPAMIRGPAGAPVTVLEFSDYQ
jgi:hypothetical protein